MSLIGVFTDSHYHAVNFPSRLATVQSTVNAIRDAGADLILHLGDMYEDNNGDFLAQIQTQENVFTASGVPTILTVGNHDLNGISIAQYLGATSLMPGADANGNYTYDVGYWRIIVVNNIDTTSGNLFAAVSATLGFLQSALTSAHAANKYVIVASHAALSQNYPGNPPIMTSGNYSFYSYNASAQRALIDTAVGEGTKVIACFCGHGHINLYRNVNGVSYYEFKTNIDTGSGGSYALVDLADNGGISIRGFNGQSEYNIAHPGVIARFLRSPTQHQ